MTINEIVIAVSGFVVVNGLAVVWWKLDQFRDRLDQSRVDLMNAAKDDRHELKTWLQTEFLKFDAEQDRQDTRLNTHGERIAKLEKEK